MRIQKGGYGYINNRKRKALTGVLLMAAAGIAEEEATKRSQAQTAAIMKEVKDYSAKDLKDKDVVRDLREDLSKRLESQGLTGREKMQTVDMIVREMKTARGVSTKD